MITDLMAVKRDENEPCNPTEFVNNIPMNSRKDIQIFKLVFLSLWYYERHTITSAQYPWEVVGHTTCGLMSTWHTKWSFSVLSEVSRSLVN